jgi:peptidoglycan hydrolase-like protein with peptidoglycan-binding domain
VVVQMPNPDQPIIASGATGDAVRRLQRALRRTPILGLVVDGGFGPTTEAAVRDFQQSAGLAVDGVVGPLTWAALPDGRPMPTLEEGSIGAVVRSLQEVLLNGASGQWYTAPGAFDGEFGPYTKVFGAGVSDLGRRESRWRRWRPDLGGFVARGIHHA